MERMTEWRGGHGAGLPGKDCYTRLAEYEDSGLTPEECAAFAKFQADYDSAKDDIDIVRIIEILTADAEGRLIVLPCKVGDTVYYITGYGIYKAKAITFRFNKSGIRVYCERKYMGVIGFEGIYGKTVFLSREEAEAALEAMAHD